eukprot:PhF_6_TR25142/c1_g1_i3/m.34613
MNSLFHCVVNPCTDTTSSSSSLFLPLDCIRHIHSMCDKSTSLTMFLVCRSWYHCVERYLCLADTYYNLPEAYRDPSPQHSSDVHKWCNGSQLWKFKQERDERWNSVQVVRLEATTRCLDFLPDSIEDLFLKTSTKIQTTRIIDIEALTSFTSLKKVSLRGCQKISFRGLELIRALEELDLSESGVSGVGFLRSCQ